MGRGGRGEDHALEYVYVMGVDYASVPCKAGPLIMTTNSAKQVEGYSKSTG